MSTRLQQNRVLNDPTAAVENRGADICGRSAAGTRARPEHRGENDPGPEHGVKVSEESDIRHLSGALWPLAWESFNHLRLSAVEMAQPEQEFD
jgi:hypothetical protein